MEPEDEENEDYYYWKERQEEKMKVRIKAEISCDEHGYPIYQEEDIECKTVFFMYGITVTDIGEKDGLLIVGVKERFTTKTSENGFSQINKMDFIPSNRIGKHVLDRCYNCEKANDCKWLIGNSVRIRH